MGETSALLILLGGLFLIYKRIITWHIPLVMMATIALLAGVMNLYDPDHYAGPIYHLVSGATLLGAFFIATDLVTSPVSARGQIIFAAGCGILVYIIRTWAGYPEGVAFAVMIMNACTPLIDHWVKPRVYGRDRRGEAARLRKRDGEGPMSKVAEPGYRKRAGYQAGLLGGFTMMAAAFLVMGNIATRDAIEQRRAEDLLASLSQVIPAEIHDNDLLANRTRAGGRHLASRSRSTVRFMVWTSRVSPSR